MKQNLEKIMKKVFENLTWGRRIPSDSMKSWDGFNNFGHKLRGGGYIEPNKTNPTYSVDSCYSELGWRYQSQMRSG